jgi:hypothetical protein
MERRFGGDAATAWIGKIGKLCQSYRFSHPLSATNGQETRATQSKSSLASVNLHIRFCLALTDCNNK